MNLKNFFKDKNGEVVIFQKPNWLLYCWAIISVINFFIKDDQLSKILSSFSTILLIIWAALEIYSGRSPFRRALGVVVLGFSISNIL